MEVTIEADKENSNSIAAPSQIGDANPEVASAQENHAHRPCASNLTPLDSHLCLSRSRTLCAQLSLRQC